MAIVCRISREQFEKEARDLAVVIGGGGREFLAQVKLFSTGSLGWYLNDKMTLEVGETPVIVQVGCTLTIVGSKALPEKSQ